MQIENTNTLITGASQGLGLALAQLLAEHGANVVMVARTEETLTSAVDSIKARGYVAHGIAADIGDKQAVHGIAGRAAALVGDIDLLINNASTLGPTPLRLLLDTDCEDVDDVLATNLVGPFRLTKLIAGNMALRGRGTVINISSDAAVNAYATWGAYSASKAALDHLTRIWQAELADTGVRFFAIDPGEMNTAMHAAALPDADPAELLDPAVVANRIASVIRSNDANPQVRLAVSP